jgi:ankyrin repeat protein
VCTSQEDGATPLIMACTSGGKDVVNLLLTHGANLHAQCKVWLSHAVQNALHGHTIIFVERCNSNACFLSARSP